MEDAKENEKLTLLCQSFLDLLKKIVDQKLTQLQDETNPTKIKEILQEINDSVWDIQKRLMRVEIAKQFGEEYAQPCTGLFDFVSRLTVPTPTNVVETHVNTQT